MTTTPTLYVKRHIDTVTWETVDSPDGKYTMTHTTPATHDELIAAMSRCGTCGHWKHQVSSSYKTVATLAVDRKLRIKTEVWGCELNKAARGEIRLKKGSAKGFEPHEWPEYKDAPDFGCTEHEERNDG